MLDGLLMQYLDSLISLMHNLSVMHTLKSLGTDVALCNLTSTDSGREPDGMIVSVNKLTLTRHRPRV
jgi:hypothetical protein